MIRRSLKQSLPREDRKMKLRILTKVLMRPRLRQLKEKREPYQQTLMRLKIKVNSLLRRTENHLLSRKVKTKKDKVITMSLKLLMT